jgi:hypothetical protein
MLHRDSRRLLAGGAYAILTAKEEAMNCRRLHRAAAVAFCALISAPIYAENIIFPHVKAGISDASGIIDVSLPPHSIDRTGKTDVTAKLQRIIDSNKVWTTIYFPNGTYLVSNTIRISEICVTGGSGNCGVNAPMFQGQSRAGTVIKLAAGSFTSATSSKPVLFSGDGVAQIFRRGIRNLTVLVGPNNAGANGIRWFGNNIGLMADVNVISQDGAANIGVDLSGGEQGPCGMRDIYVKGFPVGVQSDALNSMTVWNLKVENASTYGVLNTNNPLYIDNYTSINNAIGVRNQGSLTLVDAQLTGGTAAKSAIENTGILFARNIRAQGYQKALTTSGRAGPSGLTFDEYSSAQISQFPSPTHSMNLPARQMPDVPWEQDSAKWGNIWVNKGGIGSTPKSDSASLQSLIDNPSITTICVPFGRTFQINGDILIRGNIKRIVGTGGSFIGNGRLIITNELAQPAIKIERISGLRIVNQSNATVIVESYSGILNSTATGDFFISDVTLGCEPACPVTFNSPAGRVWAWQFNLEGTQPNGTGMLQALDVFSMRIFGWKDEGNGNMITLTKGALELLGFMQYATLDATGYTEFIIKDGGQFSLSCATQTTFVGAEYRSLVTETRGGVTKTLTSSNNGTGFNLPLYCGYDSAAVAPALPVASRHDRGKQTLVPMIKSKGNMIAIAGIDGHTLRPATVSIFSMAGSCIASAVVRSTGAGFFEIGGLRPGAYTVVVSAYGRAARIPMIIP